MSNKKNTIEGPTAQKLLEDALAEDASPEKDETLLDIKALLQGISQKLSSIEELLTETVRQNKSTKNVLKD